MTRALQIPHTLSGRYAIERELGRGAMGCVYLARDLKHGREVAVKVLATDSGQDLSAERFFSEVRTAAGLNHPHILAVHDSGEGEDGLLYYVMPRVEGESLRDLLDREGRLPVDEAVAIARQVATGLAYAHARGVIHRDIKPGNILLDRTGHAYLADFGLALALGSVSSVRRTATGTAVGSPLYMSPEQAAGERDLDARSDIYSLGCVLFEMLAGAPPFEGSNVRDVLMRHLTAPAPSLRSRRADVPPALDGAVRIALAKDSGERYPTADAFDRALQLEQSSTPEIPSPGRRRLPSAAGPWLSGGLVAATVGLLIVLVALIGPGLPPLLGGADLDSTRYVVLPVQSEPGLPDDFRPDLQLHEAFERWQELELVSRLQVGDALQRAGGGALTGRQALEIARSLGAGRYVFGQATFRGDSARLDVALFDAMQGGRELGRARAVVAREEPVPSRVSARLADELLFGRVSGVEPSPDGLGTTSVTARRDYGAAHMAVQDWDLRRADSLFEAAAQTDPTFTRAHVWLAQVRNWADRPTSSWRTAAERAAREPEALSEYERSLARGLAAIAREDFDAACEVYQRLVERNDADFAAWYGLGECRRLDNAVVRDPSSPSGWRFRSSYHRAVEAYRRAFETLPLTHRGATFERLLDLFFTQPNRPRAGQAGGADTLSFVALPTLRADTLAFVPYPQPLEPATWRRLQGDPGTTEALYHQRRLVHELAEHWAADFPDSPDALEALGITHDMLGDPAAVGVLRRAWTTSTSPERRLRLMSAEVWARVKFGVPYGVRDLDMARVLADSVLARAEALDLTSDALPSLSLLVGDPARAAIHARRLAEPMEWRIRVPRPLSATGAALNVFSAAGGPTDSIIALEDRIESAVRNTMPASDRDRARHVLLERAAVMALPVHRFGLFDQGFEFEVGVGTAYALLLRGDTAGAVEVLTPASSVAGPASTMTFDMLYPTAWLLAAAGRPEAAVARLDAAFDALRWTQPGTFDDLAHAGGLLRAIGLRAGLAQRAGDRRTARSWQATFDALWGRASPEVREAALRTPPVPTP